MPNSDLSAARLHSALLHFLELAVAHEGNGVEVVSAEDGQLRQDDPAALSCLSKVVALLEADLARQHDAQRKALAVALHTDATALFEKLKADPEGVDLDAAARELAHGRGLVAGDGLLDALVVARHDLKGGPSQAAARQVADLAGVSDRTVYSYGSGAGALPLARTAFGRWVPQGLCRKYAQDALTSAPAGPAELDRLDAISPEVHRALDAKVEANYRQQVIDMFEHVLLGELPEDGDDALAEIRQVREEIVELSRKHGEVVTRDAAARAGQRNGGPGSARRRRSIRRALSAFRRMRITAVHRPYNGPKTAPEGPQQGPLFGCDSRRQSAQPGRAVVLQQHMLANAGKSRRIGNNKHVQWQF